MSTKDGVTFSSKRVYLTNSDSKSDTEQAPTLIKRNNGYWFYATWYQYEPIRKNKGIAIWYGTSLEQPNFVLVDTITLETIYTVDKVAQLRVGGHLYFAPKPHRFDLWHFDLVEHNDGLFMVASEEKGDVIMIGYSKNNVNFKFKLKPLVDNHFMENYCEYRQYYYKPTAIIENDSLYLFYTTNDKVDAKQNILMLGVMGVNELSKN